MPTPVNGPQNARKHLKIKTTPMNLDVQSALRRFKADFLTTEEAAEETGLQASTIRKYCQDGCFTNTKVFGNEWMVSRFDLDWWVKHRLGRLGRPPAHEQTGVKRR